MSRMPYRSALGLLLVAEVVVACSEPDRPTGPELARVGKPVAANLEHEHQSAAGDTKALIGAWFNGEPVLLRYTRLYYCQEPKGASPATFCEVGTPPEDFPRPGNMPKIYALAPVGFTPDPSTVHCPGGVVCPNHPPTIDLPPLGDAATNAYAPAHSHIITEHKSGWHNTVNIRVTSLAVWNEIAAAKSLAKVRELQAAGRLGPDLPTNIFFFFEVHITAPGQ